MRRRDYLAAIATGAVGGTAGCNETGTGGTPGGRPTSAGRTASPSTDGRPYPGAASGGPDSLPVPKSELTPATARDAIPAIADPAYGSDWSDVAYTIEEGDSRSYRYAPSLDPEDEVLGVVRDGRPRAYPLQLLDWHEVVNDDLGGPLLSTYCPVCRSGVVAERRVDGSVLTFGVSGYLYRANLVLYDRETESLWSQLMATAIRGPRTRTEFSLIPSTLTSWATWRRDHPETDVLLPPPRSDTVVGEVRFNYDIDLFGRMRDLQERNPDLGPLGDLEWSDTRLRRRTVVIGVATEGAARAYPRRLIRYDGPINDVVGERPVVVALADDDTLLAYDRRVDGVTLTFEAGPDGGLVAGGSRWNRLTGSAQDGPYKGTRLRSASGSGQLYWAAWLQFHPDTTVYGVD